MSHELAACTSVACNLAYMAHMWPTDQEPPTACRETTEDEAAFLEALRNGTYKVSWSTPRLFVCAGPVEKESHGHAWVHTRECYACCRLITPAKTKLIDEIDERESCRGKIEEEAGGAHQGRRSENGRGYIGRSG